MKQGFLTVTVIGMAMLIATSVTAARRGGQGDGPGDRGGPEQGMQDFRGPGGPGGPEGHGGPGEGMRGPRGEGGGHGRPPQDGPGRFLERMLEPETAEELGLDEDQIAALKNGLEGLKDKEETLREELKTAAKAQAELLSEKGSVDEQALMNAIEKTGAIRTEMAKLRIQPIVLVKNTLTEEQIQKSRRMMHERMQKRREQMGRHEGQGGGRDRDAKREEWRKHKKDRDEKGESGKKKARKRKDKAPESDDE